MKWPFAWRATVDQLNKYIDLMQSFLDKSNEHYLELCRMLGDRERRITALLDTEQASPEALAEVFAGFQSDKQAKFFNALGKTTALWKHHRGFQFAYIMDELNLDGAEFLIELAGYASDKIEGLRRASLLQGAESPGGGEGSPGEGDRGNPG
jgi:hypothetical protein